jgi:S-(hydroxymethyl)glutathione dehydrogenase / alcohol dehydrogenase
MPQSMKAAVHTGTSDRLEIVSLDLDDPRPGEVLVRLGASGVCGSDRHVVDGDWPMPTPTVLGHEGAGVVEAVGAGVTTVQPGDHVILSWFAPCQKCFSCASGKAWACTRTRSVECVMPDGTTRHSMAGSQAFPYLGLGTMAEYTVVPESAAVAIPKEVPFDVASLIGCSVTTGVGAVVNNARVTAGSSAVVIGCGGVGLSVIMGLALAGANPIIAVDISQEKLDTARRFGATHTILASETTVADVRAIVAEGVDYSFEAIGRVASIEQLPALTRAGGTAVIVGLPPVGHTATIDPLSFAELGLTLVGSNYGGAVPLVDFPRIADLYLAGKLPLDELISDRVALEDINEALDAMRRGERTRSVIVF